VTFEEPTVAVLPGLCSVTFRNLSAGAVIAAAAGAQLCAIEWGADVHVLPGDLEAAAGIAAQCAEVGIACPSYGTYLGVDSTSQQVIEVCETARALGASNLRVWTPFGEDHTTAPARRSEITSRIADIARVADDHALTVGVEFHGWTLTHTAHSAVRLVTDVGAPNLFSYWQPNYWDEGVLDDPSRQLGELRVLLDHLAHLHIYWWRGLERFPLSDGQAVVRDALALATRPGRWHSARYAFLEFVPGDSLDSLERDAATLHRWLASEPTAR
jgi:sugar phosphate isomerase/epimerase